MSRNAPVLFLVLAISGISVVALAGYSRLSGPILYRFGQSYHGVHCMDLFVVAAWAASMAACWRLWRQS